MGDNTVKVDTYVFEKCYDKIYDINKYNRGKPKNIRVKSTTSNSEYNRKTGKGNSHVTHCHPGGYKSVIRMITIGRKRRRETSPFRGRKAAFRVAIGHRRANTAKTTIYSAKALPFVK